MGRGRGVGVRSGVWEVGVARFGVGEKDKKKKKKREKKLCSERDLNPRPSDYKSCT